ncbi:MAG: sensor histidine kinase [Acidobacteriota bacterium]
MLRQKLLQQKKRLISEVPNIYTEDFRREHEEVSYYSVNFFMTTLLIIITLVIIGTDTFNWQKGRFLANKAYLYLFYSHLAAFLLALSYIIARKLHGESERFKHNHNIVAAVAGLIMVVWGAVISGITQMMFGDIVVYMLMCFSVSMSLYHRPLTNLVIYLIAHPIFIMIMIQTQQNPEKLQDVLLNGTIAAVAACTLSILAYNIRLRDYLRRKTIEEQSALLSSVLNVIDEAIVVTDRNLQIQAWNKRANDFFELARIGYIGQYLNAVPGLSPQNLLDAEAFTEWLNKLFDEPIIASDCEITQINAGQQRILQVYCAPIYRSKGFVSSMVLAFRDTTHEKEVDRMKTEFIATVSHELRTPLTSIIGFTKIMLRESQKNIFPLAAAPGQLDPQVVGRFQESVSIVINEAERLTRLINDLLDVAKIEAGKIEWQMAPISVGDAVRDSVRTIHSLSLEKGLPINYDEPKDLPMVFGDDDRLVQVITNLLSNSIKFTEHGQISIHVEPFVAGSDGISPVNLESSFGVPNDLPLGRWIMVAVKDTGIGLTPEQADKVFDRFQQITNTKTGEKPKGTGLGLYITKEIIERHQGRIWVTSQPGQGSCFAFVLPVVEDTASE